MAGAEKKRILETKDNNGWKHWGPYLTERQWGTVREDYSPDGSAWEFCTHDMARSKAYRWGEEGLMGISDSKQILCFSVALWNQKDPIIKERVYGLTGNEGNHGEDPKDYYYYVDSTPTHSYMKALYKYPQNEFPYSLLINENRKRNRDQPEYELIDTGVLNDNKYFDVFTEYAKGDAEDILIKITIANRGAEEATLNVLPTIWFRNSWSWGYDETKPSLEAEGKNQINIKHQKLGIYHMYCDGNPELLFCDNDTNYKKLYNAPNSSAYCKDGINNYLVNGDKDAVNPAKKGTKAAVNYLVTVKGGKSVELVLRLTNHEMESPFAEFKKIFTKRIKEADEFYEELQVNLPNDDQKLVQRQAYAGMLWTKQFFNFNVNQWLKGDPGQVAPPANRKFGRNSHWEHLNAENILSMPDKWEYPWFAAWDTAFHTIPLCRLDPWFAKRQLEILLREYYMHPNGQIPAYEWNFGDVNPPVHGWATWRVYEIDKEANGGVGDTDFLEKIFHKLLLNFTWWVNQKDSGGNNIFEGGFLGLDNIGVFDRSRPLPTGGTIEQADGTSWMAMYALNMLRIAVELSLTKPVYQDMASKFFEHFLQIAGALNALGGEGVNLWDDQDDFFYDMLHLPNGPSIPLRVRSMVGLIPLYAVETLDPETLDKLPIFKRRVEFVLKSRPDLASLVSRWHEPGKGETRLLSLVRGYRMSKILKRMLDESEFLSEYGIRALSRFHLEHPYEFNVHGELFSVKYTPAESNTSLFGGNSNWRGPIWMPVNYLIIESLIKFYHYYGDEFKVEYPTGSGQLKNIKEIAMLLSQRLMKIFLKNENGERPVNGSYEKFQKDPYFKDLVLFYEYFHGDNGSGIGAPHQTGWTGVIADLIHDFHD